MTEQIDQIQVENTEQISESQPQSLGEIFHQSRTAANLSIEDVAKVLNLRPSVLKAIENNEFIHKSIPTTFMKGYIRSYARFLKISEDLWIGTTSNLNEQHKNDLERNKRNSHYVNPHARSSRWIGSLSLFILAVVLGMTALWWWENYQKSSAERENLVQNYVTGETANTNQNDSTSSANLLPVVTTPTTTTNNSTVTSTSITSKNESEVVTNVLPVAETGSITSPQDSDNKPLTLNIDNPSVIAAQEQSNTANSEEPVLILETNVIEEQAQPATNMIAITESNTQTEENVELVANNTESSTTATESLNTIVEGQGDLHISVSGECWLRVTDATRKILAEKVYRAGDEIDVQGQRPYRLTIGAPQNVKITNNGEEYPLTVNGRVARITLQ